MKRSFVLVPLIFMVALAILVLPACKKSQKSSAAGGDSTVLARVGKKEITAGAVEKILEGQKAQMQGRPINADTENMLKKRILDYLINIEILEQEAARLGIKVTDNEVDRELKSEIKRLGGQDQLNQELQQHDMIMGDLKDRMRHYLVIRKIHDKVTENIPNATQDEARKYYNENKQHFGTKSFDQVREDVIKMLTTKKKSEAYEKYVDYLRSKAKVEYPNPIPN